MSRFLLGWELGGGNGHLQRLRALGDALVNRGHDVIVAAKDLRRASRYFQGTGIEFVPAPMIRRSKVARFDQPVSYGQLLFNIGFGDAEETFALASAWRTMTKLVSPHLVVADHSPTLILAMRNFGVPTAMVGTGFYYPPDGDLLPRLRPWIQDRDDEIERTEQEVLDRVNLVLHRLAAAPLERLGRLYADAGPLLLTTYPEIDHFGLREQSEFYGIFPAVTDVFAQWPSGYGPKVFAYLKAFPQIEEFIKALGETGFPTIVVSEEATVSNAPRQAYRNVLFRTEPVDIDWAARECDFAVTNSGHGVAASMLLAGKPLILIPLLVEQWLVADRIERYGAGSIVPPFETSEFATNLRTFASTTRYREKAAEFAIKHSGRHPEANLLRVVQRLEALASPTSPRSGS